MNMKFRLILIFSSIFIFITTAYLLITHYNGYLSVIVMPEDTSYKIQNITYKGNIISKKIKSGKYQVEFTRDGFVTKKETIIIGGNKQNSIKVYLSPSNTKVDFNNLSPDEQKETIADAQNDFDAKTFTDKFSLSKYLPYKSDNFYIDYEARNEGDLSPILKITLFTSQSLPENIVKNEVLTWIRSKNIDPIKYELQYSTKQKVTESGLE